MIARSVVLSVAFLIGACGSRAPVVFAQDQAPTPREAPSTNAAGAADAAAAAAPAIVTDARDYRIGPEDVLDIAVWKNPDLSRDRVPVRPDGKVSLPLVNDIQASGLTANELRAQLAQRLAPFIQNPEVSVIVREVNSFKVSVNGNVNMPGQYGVKSEATVLDMIARAQGFNTFADKGSIWVVRRNGTRQEQLKFNYDDAIRARGNANFFVKPGDVIIVN
jgi:polysaccharide export outer membrane protein